MTPTRRHRIRITLLTLLLAALTLLPLVILTGCEAYSTKFTYAGKYGDYSYTRDKNGPQLGVALKDFRAIKELPEGFSK